MTTIKEKVQRAMNEAIEIARQAGYGEVLDKVVISIELSGKMRKKTWGSAFKIDATHYRVTFSKPLSRISSRAVILSIALHELAHVIAMYKGYNGRHGKPWKEVYQSLQPHSGIAKKHFMSSHVTYDKRTLTKHRALVTRSMMAAPLPPTPAELRQRMEIVARKYYDKMIMIDPASPLSTFEKSSCPFCEEDCVHRDYIDDEEENNVLLLTAADKYENKSCAYLVWNKMTMSFENALTHIQNHVKEEVEEKGYKWLNNPRISA